MDQLEQPSNRPARRPGGRPLGELALAMLQAAQQGPATVKALSWRAQVGYGSARYTASRMLARGMLVVVKQARPAVVGLPGRDAAEPCTPGAELQALLARW